MTQAPGLLEVVRNKIRVKHFSIRTENRTFNELNHIFISTRCNCREIRALSVLLFLYK